jgi:iron complex transport system substrate-binding protein
LLEHPLLTMYHTRLRRARRTPRAAPLLAALLLLLPACGGEEVDRRAPLAADSVSAVDDAGRTVALAHPARRVVSLVPSGTETLVALGAGAQVVGRTRYDTAPDVAHLPSVGGGLDPSVEALLSLRPDLVVAWDADKSPGLRQRLEEVGVPVFALRTRDTTDVFRNVERLGHLVGRESAADQVAARIRVQLEEVRASVAGRPRPSVLYVVWNAPPTTAGPNTFIAQVIEAAGGRTLFPDLKQDWPQVSMEEIVRRQLDVVVLPVGESPAHSLGRLLDAPGWRELAAVREGRIVEVPTDLMSRPGPHLGEAARVMRDALH